MRRLSGTIFTAICITVVTVNTVIWLALNARGSKRDDVGMGRMPRR